MNVLVRNRTARFFFPLEIILLVAGASLAGEPKSANLPRKEAAVKNVGVDEFERLRLSQKTITLDVRTPDEFARGHLPGAVNIDWNSRDFAEKAAALDKSQTYLIHCAGGVRSAKACARMTKLNFTNLYNLEGGFKAWEEAGKPVEKSRLDPKTPPEK